MSSLLSNTRNILQSLSRDLSVYYLHEFEVSIGLGKDELQEWTGHSTLISENLKLVEISKNDFNTT